MTQLKKAARWLAPAAILLLLTLVFTSLPVYAAEEGEGGANGDTTGTTEASVEFESGKLRLESAPALDFGLQAISHEAQAYAAVSASPNLQVSDLRGSGDGWDLFVSLSPFLSDASGAVTLKAAGIQLTAPTVSAVNGTVGAPPKAEADVTLTSDGVETLLWKAGPGEGMGVWSLGWDVENIQLKVMPGTAEAGRSAATVTWSLQNTP